LKEVKTEATLFSPTLSSARGVTSASQADAFKASSSCNTLTNRNQVMETERDLVASDEAEAVVDGDMDYEDDGDLEQSAS